MGNMFKLYAKINDGAKDVTRKEILDRMVHACALPCERLHLYFGLMKGTVSEYWDGLLKGKSLEVIPCTVQLQNGEDYVNTYINQMPCKSSLKT